MSKNLATSLLNAWCHLARPSRISRLHARSRTNQGAVPLGSHSDGAVLNSQLMSSLSSPPISTPHASMKSLLENVHLDQRGAENVSAFRRRYRFVSDFSTKYFLPTLPKPTKNPIVEEDGGDNRTTLAGLSSFGQRTWTGKYSANILVLDCGASLSAELSPAKALPFGAERDRVE